jgi:large conductance mechanosensitive channel
MLKGFKDFLLRGNVIDLAVAVVVGGAFNGIVSALVKDVITPLIGLLGVSPDFSNLVITVNHNKFMIGDFVNSVISFLIMASVIYFLVVTPMNKLVKRMKHDEKVDPTEKTCPECLSSIPFNARRCKYCTAVLS